MKFKNHDHGKGKIYIDGKPMDESLHIPDFEFELTGYIKEPPEFLKFKEMTKGKIKGKIKAEFDPSVFNCRCTLIHHIDYYINIPVETQAWIIRKAIEKFMGW